MAKSKPRKASAQAPAAANSAPSIAMDAPTVRLEDNKLVIGAIVSLIFPGVGLLFSTTQKAIGIGIFVLWLLFWWVLPYPLPVLLNILAAVYTYDVLAKESGATPLLFK